MKPSSANIRLCLLCALCCVLCRCAQQVSPGGGPKDLSPPHIVSALPENYSTGFSGDRIRLKFDEFIHQNNIYSEMIIAPVPREKPELKFGSKSIDIRFAGSLSPNTTYVINFGKGIADITENNPLDSNLFVFSTGTFLDSLSIGGVIKEAATLEPVEDVMIMIYKDTLDSVPYRQKPDYFTRSGKAGKWIISYLKPGLYKVFALQDANADYLFNIPEESIAFKTHAARAGHADSLVLRLFTEDVQRQYLKKVTAPFYGQLLFVFNRPAKKARAELLHDASSGWYLAEHFTTGDTLCYWLTRDRQLDTLRFLVFDGDSLLDTASVVVPPKNAKSKLRKNRQQKQDKLSVKSNIIQKKTDASELLKLRFSHPIKEWKLSGVVCTEGQDTVEYIAFFADSLHRRLHINYNREAGKDYRLFIPPGAFTDIFGIRNDTIDLHFSTRKEEEYGMLKLHIVTSDTITQRILMLLDSRGKIIAKNRIYGNRSLQYSHLLPGSYKIKMIYDVNGNGQWDTGNYLKKRQPEKIIFYSGKLSIKGNWDQEIDWKVE